MAWTMRRVNHDYNRDQPDRRYVLENGNLELQLRDWSDDECPQVLLTEDEADELASALDSLDGDGSFDELLNDDSEDDDDDNVCPECGQEME